MVVTLIQYVRFQELMILIPTSQTYLETEGYPLKKHKFLTIDNVKLCFA